MEGDPMDSTVLYLAAAIIAAIETIRSRSLVAAAIALLAAAHAI